MQPNLSSLSERPTLDEVHPRDRIPSVRHLTSDSYRHENRSPASTRPSPRCVYPPPIAHRGAGITAPHAHPPGAGACGLNEPSSRSAPATVSYTHLRAHETDSYL